MQRKPRKEKVLFDITVATKTTGIMKHLAKCECSGETIKGFTFTAFGFCNDIDLMVEQEDGTSFTWTLPSSKIKQFVTAGAKLESKHVIVQYYS